MAFDFTTDEQTNDDSHTQAQILKSSALFGGSSMLTIGIGIVRTKAMAAILGPAGFGLFGVYSSLVNLAQCITGLGVNSSGVRQIAQAASTRSESQIACTVLVLRRASILLGRLSRPGCDRNQRQSL